MVYSSPAPLPEWQPIMAVTIALCRQQLKQALATVTHNATQCQTEADWLFTHATGVLSSYALAYPEAAIEPHALATLNKLLHQRVVQRCPIQYLMGTAVFYGLSFQVSPAVLIPRPETELLVEATVTEVLRRLKQTSGPVHVVDVGTGSGCIPIAVGHSLRSKLPSNEWQRVVLSAVDCSEDALAIAQHNATLHDIPITFYYGRWLEPILQQQIKVDIIVSNPPYIPSAVCDGLEPEVINHEPRLALDGGPDGLEPYRELLRQARQCFNHRGWVGLEFGDGQATALSALATDVGFLSQVVKDFSGKERFLQSVFF